MFKRLAVALLAFTLIASLCSCNTQPHSSPTSDSATSTTTADNDAQTDTTDAANANEDVTPENWGITGRFTARNGSVSETCYINLPLGTGDTSGTGFVAINHNNTAILYAGQYDDPQTITAASELFPAKFDAVKRILKSYYGLRATSDFELSLVNDTPITVGDYDMHSFEGAIQFDYEDEYTNYKFIAYATQLKSNGAYAYWFVYDTSDNQSNSDLIAEYALNMAKTFREE